MTDKFPRTREPSGVVLRAPSRAASDARRVEVAIERTGSATRLCLRGTLSTVSAATAYDSIVACAALPTRELHLDLDGLETATRAGCRAIHVAAKLLHGRGGRMTISGVRPNVARVLKDTGFDNLIEFRDATSPSAAMASTCHPPRAALVWPSPDRRAS